MIARDVEAFYIAMARRTDLSVTPLVTFIRAEGKLVAASLNAMGMKLMECLVIAHDPAFQRYSPGILLLCYQAKWAFEAGHEFDMLRHDADFKMQWANHIALNHRHAIFFTLNSVASFAVFVGLALHKIGKLCADRKKFVIRVATAGASAVWRSGRSPGTSTISIAEQTET